MHRNGFAARSTTNVGQGTSARTVRTVRNAPNYGGDGRGGVCTGKQGLDGLGLSDAPSRNPRSEIEGGCRPPRGCFASTSHHSFWEPRARRASARKRLRSPCHKRRTARLRRSLSTGLGARTSLRRCSVHRPDLEGSRPRCRWCVARRARRWRRALWRNLGESTRSWRWPTRISGQHARYSHFRRERPATTSNRVRKAVKALLEHRGLNPGREHRFEQLAAMLPKEDPWSSRVLTFDQLSPAATTHRYPPRGEFSHRLRENSSNGRSVWWRSLSQT
jgi:hypothetical protein